MLLFCFFRNKRKNKGKSTLGNEAYRCKNEMKFYACFSVKLKKTCGLKNFVCMRKHYNTSASDSKKKHGGFLNRISCTESNGNHRNHHKNTDHDNSAAGIISLAYRMPPAYRVSSVKWNTRQNRKRRNQQKKPSQSKLLIFS